MDRKKFNLLLVALATLIICAGFVDTQAQMYSGQATAVRSTVATPLLPVLTTAVADSGRLPSAGGNVTLASTAVNIPNVLSVGDSTISTNGAAGVVTSTADVNLLNVGVLSNTISATVIGSSAQASCPAGTASGNATITNLQINGLPISVSGSPNQTITVFLLGNQVGQLIINEQIITPGGITVNALHLRVTDPLDLTETNVIIASSHAGIQCASIPSQNRFGGYGTGVQLRQRAVLGTDITNVISDTGFLPRQGSAPVVTSTAGAGLSPLLSTGVVTSTTQGGTQGGGNLHITSSSSQVNNLGINALNVVTIGANVVNSNTQCTCSTSIPSCSANSGVASLAVTALGLPVTINVTGAPNQIVSLPLGLGTIVINERISSGVNNISANALRISLNVAGLAATDVVVAASHSDISCAVISSSDVSVGGRVTDSSGRPLSGVTIRLAGSTGEPRTVVSSPFGYYNFENVSAGQTFFVEASKKGLSFSPRVIVPVDDMIDLDFTPQGGRGFK